MDNIPRSVEEYRERWAGKSDVPYGYCWCGCGERTPIAACSRPELGHIEGEPVRFIRGHSSRRYKNWVVEDRGHTSPCWIWRGRRDGVGYGQLYENNKLVGAHRLWYKRHRGELADDEHIHHLCGVRLCVNPDHLEKMTAQEHHSLHSRGSANPNHRISLLTVEAIRILLKDGTLTQFEIAECFGVAQTTVSKIKRGAGMYGESYGERD